MEQFYEFIIVDQVTGKQIKGVIKGTDILDMVRVLSVKYKNIDSIRMDRISAGTVFYETEVSHLKKGDELDA